jgi:hypothetical protein
MRTLATAVALLSAGGAGHAGTVLFGPGDDPYLSVEDSPFFALNGLVVEDMEDGFNTPGVVSNFGARLGPGGATDSVDADDGVIDGSGNNGSSYFYGAGATGIAFTFDEFVLGALPRFAGIVWTDGAGEITFEAFDGDGNSLGVLTGDHALGGLNGGTDEDRFYGVRSTSGIGSIHIRNAFGGIEVDHLQFIIPTGATAPVLAGACLATLRRRR